MRGGFRFLFFRKSVFLKHPNAHTDFVFRIASAYAHMRIDPHTSASSASAWPSLVYNADFCGLILPHKISHTTGEDKLKEVFLVHPTIHLQGA